LGDTVTRWTNNDVWLHDVNIHVYTHDAVYGDGTTNNAIIYANDVAFFRKINLKYLFMGNQTGGSNAVVSIVGTRGVLDKVTGMLKASLGGF